MNWYIILWNHTSIQVTFYLYLQLIVIFHLYKTTLVAALFFKHFKSHGCFYYYSTNEITGSQNEQYKVNNIAPSYGSRSSPLVSFVS